MFDLSERTCLKCKVANYTHVEDTVYCPRCAHSMIRFLCCPPRFFINERVIPDSSSFVYKIAKIRANNWYELNDGSVWKQNRLGLITSDEGRLAYDNFWKTTYGESKPNRN